MSDIPSELQLKIDQTVAAEYLLGQKINSLKAEQTRINEEWDSVEKIMIDNKVKNIKGEWGSLTIAERLNWMTTDDLPAKFYKKVVDTKKISDTFRLEGKAPKGAEAYTTKYLTKRLK